MIIAIVVLFFIFLMIFKIFVYLYLKFYNYSINKTLVNKKQVKELPAPQKFFIVALMVFFLVFLTNVFVKVHQSSDDKDSELINNFFEVYKSSEIQNSYLQIYDTAFRNGKLSGYKKYEETRNDIRCTYFISNEPNNTMHPYFILFVEYIGKLDMKVKADFMEFGYDNEHTGIYNYQEKGFGFAVNHLEPSEYYCVIGNARYASTFRYSISFFEDKDALKYSTTYQSLRKTEYGLPDFSGIADAGISISIMMDGFK